MLGSVDLKILVSFVYNTGISLKCILVDSFGNQAELPPFDIRANSLAFAHNSLESQVLRLADKRSELPLPTPRGLSREAAAAYIGVSPSKFDMFVADGTMPKPIRLGRRCVWDIQALDKVFSPLSSQEEEADPFAGVFEE